LFSARTDTRLHQLAQYTLDVGDAVTELTVRVARVEASAAAHDDLVQKLIGDAERARDHLAGLQTAFDEHAESLAVLNPLTPLVQDLVRDVRSLEGRTETVEHYSESLQKNDAHISSRLEAVQKAHDEVAADLHKTSTALREFAIIWRDVYDDVTMLANNTRRSPDD
jgi:methyl-accepting chemotaxis protein